MNLWLFTAGLLSLATAAIHAFLGGPEINAAVQASDLSISVRTVSAVVWHGATSLFVIDGVALMLAARRPDMGAAAVVCMFHYVALAVLFIGYAAVRFGNPVALPQWILFVAIAVLTLLGLNHRARTTVQEAR